MTFRVFALCLALSGCASGLKTQSGFIEPKAAFEGKPLLVEEVPGSRLWELQRQLLYRTDDGLLIRAKKGTRTNFASTPQWIWWLYPPWSPEYGRATVIHDRLYDKHGVVTKTVRLTRQRSDEVLREAMRDTGAGKIQRNIFYGAVRVGNPEWPEDKK